MGLGWNVRVKNEKLEREVWHEYDQITIYALQNSQKNKQNIIFNEKNGSAVKNTCGY